MIYYSPSTKGFYDTKIHSSAQIPPDAIIKTASEYRSLLEAQAQGKEITPDNNGHPIAVDPIPAGYKRENGQTALDIDNQFPTIVKMYTDAIWEKMDVVAQSYGYDDLKSAINYRDSRHATRAAQGKAFFDWRDDCIEYGETTLQSFMNGSLSSIPTVDEFLAGMPALVV